MIRNQRKITLVLLFSIVLCMMFALPVSAKSKGYVKAYKELLEKGSFSYSYTDKYWSDGKLQTSTYSGSEMKIDGFTLLNVDGKGVPELILKVHYASSSDEYTSSVVATYKGGKVKFLSADTDNYILFSLGKVSIKYNENGKSSRKNADAVYYSKANKALYSEYKYTDLYGVDLKGKHFKRNSIYKTLYKIKGSCLIEYKTSYKSTTTRGYQEYTTGNNKTTSVNYHSAKAYNAFDRKYFKGLKKYKFYSLTASNIKKRVK